MRTETKLRLGRVWYPVTTFGTGKKLGVWVKGCTRRCPGCISPELWPREGGLLLTPRALLEQLPCDLRPDGLVVSGGEPLDQAAAVLELVQLFRERWGEDILLYTGYTLEEAKAQGEAARQLLDSVAVLVDGAYRSGENDGRGLMGSGNQVIHRFRLGKRYEGAEHWARSVQCVVLEDRFWLIGVPPNGEGSL